MNQVQEEIFNHLKEIGLMPKIDKDGDIVFQYQMLTFVIIASEGDEHFLRIAVPNIFEVDDNNRVDVLEACNATSLRIKVAKAFITPHDSVWLVTEQLLDQTPNYEDVIPRSLRILLDARNAFRDALEG